MFKNLSPIKKMLFLRSLKELIDMPYAHFAITSAVYLERNPSLYY